MTWKLKYIHTVFDTPQVANYFKVEPDAALYSLAGNLIMIEKYSLGWDLNQGPPDLQPRRANLCA